MLALATLIKASFQTEAFLFDNGVNDVWARVVKQVDTADLKSAAS